AGVVAPGVVAPGVVVVVAPGVVVVVAPGAGVVVVASDRAERADRCGDAPAVWTKADAKAIERTAAAASIEAVEGGRGAWRPAMARRRRRVEGGCNRIPILGRL
ncbi:MAG: hypothetical protein ACRDV8_10585, partial [Acidimicrobiales bacterium]